MKIELKDIPLPISRKTKYSELWEALISAPVGKAIVVPLGTFGTGTPQAALKVRRAGRRLYTRRMPDGIYLWLDPITNGEVKR